MKKIFLPLLSIFLTLQTEGQVIAPPSDPGNTTHTLVSGNVTLGISSAGGGYMNMLELPGKGDIMDAATDMYGRGGQSAMRDGLRGGKYNPTQAGFNETLGTPSQILVKADSLVISPRMCSLWHGDGGYDYTRWENIGADPYKDDSGNSDADGIEEEDLVGKQLTEVGSEFDYYGVYENYMGRDGVSIPCFRHYYEYRFIREPGHCMSQFGPGTPIYNSNQLINDISTQYPEGTHQASEFDISNLMKVWSLRNDRSKWDPPFRHMLTAQGEWIVQSRTDDLSKGYVLGAGATYQPLVIISDSMDRDQGLALGLYRPESEINTFVIAGIDEATGAQVYKDDRSISVRMLEQPRRTPTMGKYGFRLDGKGMLNRNRMEPGIYETLRSEFYILVGTPNEIFEAANKIDELILIPPPVDQWNFDTDLEGWTLTKNLTGTVTDSVLLLQIEGPDPYMTSASDLQIDVENKNVVEIKMKNGTNTNSGRLYWMRDTDNNISIATSQDFDIIPEDDIFSTYSIDLTDHPNWNGTLSRIRLDPSNAATSGTMDIDFIKVTQGISMPDTMTYPVHLSIHDDMDIPVSGALLLLNGDTIAWSDAGGVIAFQKRAGSYELTILADGYLSYNYDLTLATDSVEMKIVLEKLQYELLFVVVNSSDPLDSIENASIVIEDWPEALLTDAHGQAVAEANGSVTYTVNKADFLEVNGEIVVTQPTVVKVELTPDGTGVAENKTGIRIYPNPARDLLILEWEEYLGAEVKIFNILGSVVKEASLSSQRTLIDLEELKQGIYMLKVHKAGSQFTGRVIIQR